MHIMLALSKNCWKNRSVYFPSTNIVACMQLSMERMMRDTVLL
ncbi:unnamed protein product [Onchocerca flexuosa]|uniref:Uncharacterized protein n=1 Tax=Onchocerca flexuosa TaxID=387005 RepID=A0A183HVM0_9BILA|nr:unnamed protein product [Onchocerca flexuosa]